MYARLLLFTLGPGNRSTAEKLAEQFVPVLKLPRVGCGNGSLDWEDVQPILERHLDDRFILVSLPSEVHHEA